MNRFHHTRIPIAWNKEDDAKVARLCDNEYTPELTFKKRRLDLATVRDYEEGILHGSNEFTIIHFFDRPSITIAEAYDNFTVAFDAHHNQSIEVDNGSQAVIYNLTKA